MWVACDGDRVVGAAGVHALAVPSVATRCCVRSAPSTRRRDPDYQGKGLFTALTMHGLDELRDDGVDFVFNTPNDQSLPGYLKMGWQVVGKVPAAFRLRGPRSLATTAKARVPADLWSLPLDVGVPVSEWLQSEPSSSTGASLGPREMVTDRSADFLAWRYGTPLLDYRAVPSGGGALVVRGRQRGGACELVLADSIGHRPRQCRPCCNCCALIGRMRPRAALR